MSTIVATADEAAKETPMHIDVTDLTFGYAGREVGVFSLLTSNTLYPFNNLI